MVQPNIKNKGQDMLFGGKRVNILVDFNKCYIASTIYQAVYQVPDV